MPLRRLLALIVGNPRVVESLSETKLMRRSAQITVGLYNKIKASTMEGNMKNNLDESLSKAAKNAEGKNSFLSSFWQELHKEHKKMKGDGKL